MKPLIGITTGEIINHLRPWAPITYGQSHTYSDAIIRAGAIPVLIPITEDMSVVRELYERLDGILFAGGNDLDPTLYKAVARPETVEISPRRDAVEVQLMQWSIEDNKPLLAICRGYQLLNVVSGGSLYQDIDSDIQDAANHELSSHQKDGTYLAHQLRIASDSKLATYIDGAAIGANTHHHQAVKDIAPDLQATAWSEDNIIEALEKPDSAYVLGVQCHPESLGGVEPRWNKLFSSFVDAAQPTR